MAKILIVDDDQSLCTVLSDFLESLGYEVEAVFDGIEGLSRLLHYCYDVVVLDWDMPKMSGIEVCQQYRDKQGKTPVIMLTGKSSIDQKVTGFDAGADDYLTKPFDEQELAIRIKAMLRRPAVYADVANRGGLSLNQRSRTVTCGKKSAELLPLEYKLLDFLMHRPDHYFDAEDLLNRVWSSESESSPEALRQCVRRLRKKLETIDARSCIESSRGAGYKFTGLSSDSDY
jgi:two-component system, OmpR family, manganese sensing response regulator